MGLAIHAVGDGPPPISVGDWSGGPAWSTIKVPLAIAGLRASDSPMATDAMRAAITQSDNAAAESIWQSLGDPPTAAAKVQEVLAETGDPTIVESRKVRPEFTAFGQTQWTLTDQATFLAAAVCDARNEPVLSLMGQITSGQSWGLGTIPGTQFKGGWGPSLDDAYLVRQMGVVATPAGMTVVAVAVEPFSGVLGDGTHALTRVADWITEHTDLLPAGNCR
ncbi:class A beta-lactamase-related serine hydrolase [Mycolicibacterium austroafricanum]|uniref:class A beta-lactamase-related serine hydrolase n=1 Tax=Mycolicibacterium austroafricanum TaxID=39687 RepID=UPI001CA330DE|nr:class A beta-lactamase-related serine hydrolase [Mycolicibacterium austroafricanum]QZT65367.1 class A beta-lactamase-related serine hydrolase [Mycolicibacterium austroafricanum]